MPETTKLPNVTDHAVLRHLERVKGFDIEAVRTEIARKTERGVRLGAASVLIDGFRYVLRGGSVVTVLHRSYAPRPPEESEDG
ncbi:MAG: hypothetical protein GYB51_00010 [Rhodobacteraceae bacterium]|nr:hypothetical protein [Paracoccaceae bacterium]